MPDTEPERVLLVEGQDDEHVVRQLCRHYRCVLHQSVPAFSIQVTGNAAKLLDAIGPAMLVSDRKAVGVLIDADDALKDRWNQLMSRFSQEGVTIPMAPDPDGTVLSLEDSPRIGIWVMPDNQSSGELEDFVREMIPSNDPVWPRSQRYVAEIPVEHQRFRPGKLLRAQLYAWLATREIPGRMGAAIGAGDLDAGAGNSTTFVNWLRKLIE